MFKYKKMSFGCIFIFFLVFTSFAYSLFLHQSIPHPPEAIYGNGHRLLDVPPYPPSKDFPLGVDRYGEDVLWKVLDGAKYTVIIALVVSVIRIIISVFAGMYYVMFLHRFTFFIETIIRAFRFIPAVILAYIFFVTIQSDTGRSTVNILVHQVLILSFIGGIPLSGYIAAEVKGFLKNDFIKCSRSLGASKSWVIRKHILNFLRPKLLILFTQQVVQSLLILVHLGVLQMLIGKVKTLQGMNGISSNNSVTLSLSNEWSGLIGLSYREMMLDQWIVLGPSIAFVLTIYSFRLIEKGLEEILEGSGPANIHPSLENREITTWNTDEPFRLIDRMK
jgi:peptide/nickel transport system permease protein